MFTLTLSFCKNVGWRVNKVVGGFSEIQCTVVNGAKYMLIPSAFHIRAGRFVNPKKIVWLGRKPHGLFHKLTFTPYWGYNGLPKQKEWPSLCCLGRGDGLYKFT